MTFDETKESIGTALLPIVDKLLKFITDTAIPTFEKFKKNAIDPVIEAVMENKGTFEGLYNFAKDTFIPFIAGRFMDTIKGLGSIAGVIVQAVAAALRALEPIINAAIEAMNKLITLKNLLSPGADTPQIKKVDFDNLGKTTEQPNTVPSQSLPFGAVAKVYSKTGGGGNLIGSTMTTIPTTPSITSVTIPSGSTGIPSTFNPSAVSRGEYKDVYINVNSPSVIDEEGFTRAVITALNNSQSRSGGGGGQLVL